MRRQIAKLALMTLMALLAAPAFAQDRNNSAKKKDKAAQKGSSGATALAQNHNNSAKKKDKAAQKGSSGGTSTTAGQGGPPVPPTTPEGKQAPPLSVDGGSSPSAGQGSGGDPAPPTPGQSSWLGDPRVLGLIGVLAFLGLALHIVHVLTEARFKKEFARLHGTVQTLSQRLAMASNTGKDGRALQSEELIQRLNRHRQGLDQLSGQISQLDERVRTNERHSAEASTAVALAAHMAGAPRISQALDQAGQDMADEDRAAAIKIVERFKEILSANVVRMKPLMQEMSVFVERLSEQPSLAPELVDRVRALLDDLLQFEKWHAEASERLAALQRGSVASRYSAFSTQQSKLVEQLNARAISIVDYVKAYKDMMETHFPAGRADGSNSIAPAELENYLKEVAAAVPDCLMNWFDKLFQLQTQAALASIDAQTAADLAQIKRAARDVLCKFDIQPEEIQIGLTSFDRRLHDAALITQSSQFPANSVIGVQQSGFRKLSTGDVLRRPKVIVAGVGAG